MIDEDKMLETVIQLSITIGRLTLERDQAITAGEDAAKSARMIGESLDVARDNLLSSNKEMARLVKDLHDSRNDQQKTFVILREFAAAEADCYMNRKKGKDAARLIEARGAAMVLINEHIPF